jgi:hypothetical protein
MTAFAVLPTGGAAGASASPLKIDWSDLRPAGMAVGATAFDGVRTDPAAGETLSTGLQGRTVEIAGYLLPSDREGDLVYQFLLIPWTGLCSHMAPPPPNQTVLITLKTPYRLGEAYETVSVTGTLVPDIEKTQLFILDGVSVIESGYRIADARVAPADTVTGGAPQPKTNPWSFLRK